jgi:tetratricopeptide (TPR) repeat protein
MLPEEVGRAFTRAEALARENRWQDVRRTLLPHGPLLRHHPRALLRLAESNCHLNDTEPARQQATEAVELLLQGEDTEGVMKARNLLGIIHFETGDLEGAQAHFLAALDLASKLGEHRVCARITNNLGSLCSLRGEHKAATQHFREALALYECLGETLGQAQTLHNLGILYRDMERYEDADTSFARAARVAQDANDHRMVGVAMVARAELMLRRGDLEAAERMARMALLRFDVHQSLFGLAEAHKLLGTLARLRGNPSGARENLGKALDYCQLHAGPLLEAETRLELGILLRETGDLAAASAELRAAAQLFEQLGALRQAERARALQSVAA